ncbi:hypothetical protein [Xanthomonas hortorum]|uniref:Uncharacterized protein n=1 Tax=Xanthomonas hortorum pv. gardneri TaxID=2754056 RepID=A0A6V7B8J7_9XANT|nr:hypothetical protein [Xanthomonas hortorum]APP78665.1 hypothetical protein BJD10_02155 [Xanthomonas hortorum pv. gardneri]EGD17609.1 hypothetical protein XGA_3785 [Xanthomonas hortorum ATCC 19865]MCC8498821.1 hypothetical protein [Xanthomonas hortorum pv. gardneri]MCC8507601.1 hypothetical protein [Xanthomonas hortorum pv. gardneri]MCC8512064.1 hypothetical protein [Xanthomonas hortorum pv. gardneri]
MATNEKTGPTAAKAASKVLRSGSTGKDSKTAAASAFSQTPDKKGKKQISERCSRDLETAHLIV